MAIQESTLRCGVCERETPHEIVYAGHAISEVHCLRCGARTRMDVSAEYPHELRERISSKPA
ncbi:MAG: hypothetical protein Q4G40_11045, partial [Brachybacterium sp.]|nr:hypothetical protein [Brachybacterium sp.]